MRAVQGRQSILPSIAISLSGRWLSYAVVFLYCNFLALGSPAVAELRWRLRTHLGRPLYLIYAGLSLLQGSSRGDQSRAVPRISRDAVAGPSELIILVSGCRRPFLLLLLAAIRRLSEAVKIDSAVIALMRLGNLRNLITSVAYLARRAIPLRAHRSRPRSSPHPDSLPQDFFFLKHLLSGATHLNSRYLIR